MGVWPLGRCCPGFWVSVQPSQLDGGVRAGELMGVRTGVSELVEADKAMIELSAELKRVSAELSALSEIDPLTGAIKRRFFDRRRPHRCCARLLDFLTNWWPG